MKYYSLIKYRNTIFMYLFEFICVIPLGVLGAALDNEALSTAFAIVLPLCIFIFLIPCLYYTYCFLNCRKKADTLPRLRGTVCNWEAGFARYRASVSVITENEMEVSSAQYFGYEEARELVGKEVEYCVIDEEILFIFEVIS